ncbi:hypothetical protein Hokovirus_5_2 [Hokovirus HKV1]|uniref:Uncharacterized protein n=1 Tax=Hokovirus HKV1 TaxID=1977638 RepID=A0A1V0SHB4_9VIRU|nr:hypothetical protein Hokovirus_5_2 [Hokovirus HKV1]
MYENYDNYIRCSKSKFTGILCLHHTTLFVFEVLDNYFNKKYIFYSNYSKRFYKTNEFIKLDYVVIDNYEFKLHIIGKLNTQDNIKYIFRFLDNYDLISRYMFKYFKPINEDKCGYIDLCFTSLTLKKPIEDLYNKVSYTKGIQK